MEGGTVRQTYINADIQTDGNTVYDNYVLNDVLECCPGMRYY